MATTFSRIYTIIQKFPKGNGWMDRHNFLLNFRKRKLKEFKIRGDGSSIDDYMKEESINNLLLLMRSLELIDVTSNGQVKITDKGLKCKNAEDIYMKQLKSSIKSYFEKKDIPMNKILEVGKSIQYPDVPNADTVYNLIATPQQGISEDHFRKMLYLYSCAGGIERKMRVHYLF